jgi:hypothetical protein
VVIVALTTFNIGMAALKMYYKVWIEKKGDSKGLGMLAIITVVSDIAVQVALIIELFSLNFLYDETTPLFIGAILTSIVAMALSLLEILVVCLVIKPNMGQQEDSDLK